MKRKSLSPKKKHKHLSLEIITKCDACGKKLPRTCVRTDGSSACAEGCGIKTTRSRMGLIRFYCSMKCRSLE